MILTDVNISKKEIYKPLLRDNAFEGSFLNDK